MIQISCACGSLQGELADPIKVGRGVCYCKSCQAFAAHLGWPLDEHGGTEVLQTSPSKVQFTSGIENLVCLRLSPEGLLRWYSKCCKTPVGNTPSNYRMSFVGLISACVPVPGDADSDQIFGPNRMRVHTADALGDPPKNSGMVGMVLKFVRMLVVARLTGRYRSTPFFEADGSPIVSPVVLDSR